MSTVKIQIPMDKNLRDGLKKRAEALGFDSVQAYIRFWAKADVDGRKVDMDVDDWGDPSPEAADRINKIADEARRGINVSKPFETTEEALDYLHSL